MGTILYERLYPHMLQIEWCAFRRASEPLQSPKPMLSGVAIAGIVIGAIFSWSPHRRTHILVAMAKTAGLEPRTSFLQTTWIPVRPPLVI